MAHLSPNISIITFNSLKYSNQKTDISKKGYTKIFQPYAVNCAANVWCWGQALSCVFVDKKARAQDEYLMCKIIVY